MTIAQVGSCTAIELVDDSTNSSNENTFLECEQNESIADLITGGTLILSVYILMSFDFPFVRLFGVR
jgi:hypothetical protein